MNSAEQTEGICLLNNSSEILSFLLFNMQVRTGAGFEEHSKDLCKWSKSMTDKYAFPGLHKCTTYNKRCKKSFHFNLYLWVRFESFTKTRQDLREHFSFGHECYQHPKQGLDRHKMLFLMDCGEIFRQNDHQPFNGCGIGFWYLHKNHKVYILSNTCNNNNNNNNKRWWNKQGSMKSYEVHIWKLTWSNCLIMLAKASR